MNPGSTFSKKWFDFFRTKSNKRTQKKTLTVTVSTAVTISELTFSSLEIGKRYRISGLIGIVYTSAAVNQKNIIVEVKDGAALINAYHHQVLDISQIINSIDVNETYTATATTLTFVITDLTNLVVSSAQNTTAMRLTEVLDEEEVSIW